MPRRVRKTPWSRTGCSDGQKPRCQTCLRLGLECVQFDIFCPINVVTPTRESRPARPDADESNISSPSSMSSATSARSADEVESSSELTERRHSSEVVVAPAQPLLHHHQQRQHQQQQHRRQGAFQTHGNAAAALDGPPMPSLSAFSYLSTSEYFFLQYYLERLSNVLVNANSRTNPLKSLILPRITSSKLLLDAICATAAVHRSSANDVDRLEYATVATRYYIRVLSAVRDLIPRVTDSGKMKGKMAAAVDKDAAEMAILASIFLCKYEIIKDGVENWRFHLRGIESLCQSLDAKQAASMTNTLTYVCSFMSYHKNIARVTEYSSHARQDEFDYGPFEANTLFPVDAYMGFSQSLIILLGRVNNFLAINMRDEPHKLRQEVEAILNLLARRSWRADRFAIPEGMGVSTIENSSHIAEAYRCAVIAYIHAVLDLVEERDGTAGTGTGTGAEAGAEDAPLVKLEHLVEVEAQAQSQSQSQSRPKPMPSAIDWASLHALLPVAKAQALTDCLAAVARVPLGCPEEAGLLPLLFIVGCETDRQDEAKEVLLRVKALGSHIGLGNVRCASALLKQVWYRRAAQRDFRDWRGLLATVKWDLIIT
ncbi:hypothetical protein Trco_003379 [Trichoderma cornu-damae]|uniref:Zn(2)-C6 fungal-type domain-containing protein n=1 Tax=Trichoderma cornu-damae TaxID=654480 RepID=A0A9P8QKY6_9HYPO|nr:hypothetical protein Trco_003379 [Trichoderma cornu-damae]